MLKPLALFICFFLVLLVTPVTQAQTTGDGAERVMVEANAGNNQIEMADQLRKDGKIYVVVGCVLVVLAGMIFYLISIDKKVSRLEKQYKN